MADKVVRIGGASGAAVGAAWREQPPRASAAAKPTILRRRGLIGDETLGRLHASRNSAVLAPRAFFVLI